MRNAAMLCLALAALSAGCSTANVSGQASSFAAAGTPPAGSSLGGGSVGIDIQGGSAAVAVVGVAAIAVLIGIWRDAPLQRAVPEMLEGRAISEVDCTQPIAHWWKNLKCK